MFMTILNKIDQYDLIFVYFNIRKSTLYNKLHDVNNFQRECLTLYCSLN